MKYALEKVGKANITLKEKQEEVLKIIALKQKDVLAVLQTGYGKSLYIYIIHSLFNEGDIVYPMSYLTCGIDYKPILQTEQTGVPGENP